LTPPCVGIFGIVGGKVIPGIVFAPNPPTPLIIKDIVFVKIFLEVFSQLETIVKTTRVIFPLSTIPLILPVFFKSVPILSGSWISIFYSACKSIMGLKSGKPGQASKVSKGFML